ncbi:hypothetical protein HYDPIDRAFT_34354 [Hydnomerulius pinastri MD-312]|uniref:Uncharacterized protein n=1 Tax=Hydnomerulius pinastri MD-312 TaxID=994086 RepID=A0A0C9UZ13_9AGAM|nr:hypothetical protein HYDPIDRAFT_34354 [Hydnomerulius pinastri MD-312]
MPYFEDLPCENNSLTKETCIENLQLSQQVDHAFFSNLPAPVVLFLVSTPTPPPSQEAGTLFFARNFEEPFSRGEQQNPDIMHGPPASVPPSAPRMDLSGQRGDHAFLSDIPASVVPSTASTPRCHRPRKLVHRSS